MEIVRACMLSCSVVLNSLQPHGLYPARFLCPWDFPGKNTGVGYHFLLQEIFPTQGSSPHLLRLLHWHADSLPLSHLGSHNICIIHNIYIIHIYYIYHSHLGSPFLETVKGYISFSLKKCVFPRTFAVFWSKRTTVFSSCSWSFQKQGREEWDRGKHFSRASFQTSTPTCGPPILPGRVGKHQGL